MIICILLLVFSEVNGHGRLMEPPSRGSLWRFRRQSPENYNDNELYCGGFSHQYVIHSGKCGTCGDPYGAPLPRPHEAGGKYGQGVVIREYRQGQVINVTVELTTNHRGHFEFTICPTNDPLKRATEECLELNKLMLADGGGFKYPIKTARIGFYSIKLQLPKYLKCSHCVLRWRYTNGNNWGICDDGVGRLGCGNQEQFYGCADVRIGKGSAPKPKPGHGNQVDIIGFKPRPLPKPAGYVRACAPIVLSTTERRFEETLKWCTEMCLGPNRDPVCANACVCS